MKSAVSILGLGWLGEPLAKSLSEAGYKIQGSTASMEGIKKRSHHPFYVGRISVRPEGIIGDWDTFMYDTDILIIIFPPKRTLDDYPERIKQICKHTRSNLNVIFISSTSVYANTNNSVFETDTPSPEKNSGKQVYEAERILTQHFGKTLTILRLAGLIGPNRHPGRFLAGKVALKNPNVPVNLIHQSDAIRLIRAIVDKKCFGEIINGCADKHPQRRYFYEKAARELNVPAPVFQEVSNQKWKIVDNNKSKKLLNFAYEFSSPEQIFTKEKMPKISIVGAGPGAPDLLTIRGADALKKANVVLHDNLASEAVLRLANHAEHIYVGRKYGDASNQDERQQNINHLIEKYHLQGKRVVRLKSGDPYIFGRAAEEVRYLMGKNLPFEVVPGISAGLAAANLHHLPVTERRKSSALLICTAHTADYTFDQLKGIAELLKDGNSLAIYMGLKSLDKLIPKLIEITDDPSIPISAISKVSRVEEKIMSSTLGAIRNELERTPLEMPVVFIVGIQPITKS